MAGVSKYDSRKLTIRKVNLMGDKVRLALVQTDTGKDLEKNKIGIERFTKNAADAGAQLIIFPEHSDAIGARGSDYAQDIPGEQSRFYAGLAKKHGLYLHCGSMTEKNGDGLPYNTSLVFNPDGEQIALYRKLHMFDVEICNGPNIKESKKVMKGDRISVLKTCMCTMGLSICYDLRFPELYRIMASLGAQLFIVSSAFTENTGRAHWESLARARAIENGCFVAAVDQCGEKNRYKAWGHTMFIDPWGEVLGELEQEEGMLIVDMDVSKVNEARNQIPSLKSRREDIYRLESEELYIYEG